MTIERRARQFIAVWNDDGLTVKGSLFEQSVFVDGEFWKNELSPVPPELEQFKEFGGLFSSTLQQQHDALAASNKTMADKIVEQTSSINNLLSQLEATKSELEADRIKLATSQTELTNANQRITFLENELPFNPREINASAFRSRLSKVMDATDFVRLYAEPLDETLETISKTLSGWPDSVPIRLDHDNLLVPLEYLHKLGILTEEEIKFLRSDSTRDEAFKE